MKDFDFDELDKAVSSVLKKQPTQGQPDSDDTAQASTDASSPPPAEPIQDITPPSNETSSTEPDLAPDQPTEVPSTPQETDEADGGAEDTPTQEPEEDQNQPTQQEVIEQTVTAEKTEIVQEKPVEEAQESEQPAKPVARPVMPQRRGRFMDVVHPSADMQTSSPPKPSRHGKKVLTPTSSSADLTPDQSEESQTETPHGDTTDTSPLTSQDDFSTHPQGYQDETKPGLDELQSSQTATEEDTDPSVPNDDDQNDAPYETTSDEQQQPQPFIEGAAQSVEKRPLGGYAPSGDLAQDQTTGASTEPYAQTSDNNMNVPSIAAEEPPLEPSHDTHPGADTDSGSQPAAQAASPGPSPFITPQYKAQEEVVDGEEHAVFDTSNYHQPLHETTQSTKKHAIFWTLLIVALFVGGAALGALYFLSMN